MTSRRGAEHHRNGARGWTVLAATALAATWLAASLSTGCKCDPEKVEVPPDDCASRPAAASVTIRASLSGIRPIGSDKQLKINGNREPGQSSCFTGDTNVLTTLTGQSEVSEAHALAHGAWKFTVTPLSGGDHAAVPEQLRTLAPGSSQTLRITSTSSGDIAIGWE
ncbi:MAG TPA: hypothetical protein VFQ61_23460 [Polyangiaceae bacterium]|nr:hypothetical protein [Polyangiaceae bacterium]